MSRNEIIENGIKIPVGQYMIKENEEIKMLRSEVFNYNFNKLTGYYEQWGNKLEDDPQRCPFGPIIADIEVTTICNFGCEYCYKNNNNKGYHLSINDYKTIIEKINTGTLTQVALGSDSSGFNNPDMKEIFKYSRSQGIIPNITIAEITDEDAEILKEYCGAVAVSMHSHAGKDICYDTIYKLTSIGMDQINMHFVLGDFSVKLVDELIDDIKNDPRLAKLNAVVFLSLKQKGRGVKFEGCSQEDYQNIIDKMFQENIRFGMDSCGAVKFLDAIKGRGDYKKLSQMVESCESLSTSIYIDAKGIMVPCSFMENVQWNSLDYKDSDGWNLLDDSIKDSKDFQKNVWNSDRALQFSFEASKCASCGGGSRGCQVYEI